jgi:iron complex outermembrane receptor protein
MPGALSAKSNANEIVIPAKAGIHNLRTLENMDSRLRGNDGSRAGQRTATLSRSALAAMLATTALPALAQTQPPAAPAPAEAATTDDIVVTAQFREQNLQRTPLAITAVNSAMLEARSQTNIAQVANQAPSVTLKPQGPAYGPSMGANIRGIGQFDFNPALEPGVGLYVDDVYYATLTGSVLDLLDVDRVEILRGPQGTLAGKNSIGGAVKLYSKKPEGTNTGSLTAAYGSRNRIDLRGSADFHLVEGLDARIAAVAKRQDGYIKSYDFGCVYPAGGPATFTDANGVTQPVNPAGGIPRLKAAASNCVLGREGDVNYQAVRGQLRHKGDKIDINFAGDFTRDDRHSAGAVLLNRSYAGVLRSPNFVDRLPGNPAGATDINPYGGNIPYDTRFICGNYCNFANFNAPADSSSGATGAFANSGGVRPATSYAGRVDFTGWGGSGEVKYSFSDALQLVSITAYRGYRSKFDNDDDLSPLAHTNNTNDLRFWSFSQELRLNGSLAHDTIEYTLGGFYMKQRSRYMAVSDIRYAGLPEFVNNDVTKANTKAVFAHVAWKPLAGLTLTGGLRYTDEFKSYAYSRRAPDGSPLMAGVSVAALDGQFGIYDGPASDRVDYRANVQYEITPTISVYGQVSTGFKGGGVNPRPFNASQVRPFGPETLTAYEAGFKSDLFDRHVRLNIATFFSKYKDLQLSLSNCTAIVGAALGVPCSLLTNAGNADIKGVEVETTIRPVRGWVIDGAASYVDFDYKKFTTFGAAAVGGPLNINGPQFGNYPTYTPRWKWSVGTQYRIDMGNGGALTPRIDAAYQSHIFYNSTNRPTNRIDGYTVANARLTWVNRKEDLEISGEVTNLFDKYYYLTGFDLTIAGAGVTSAQPGRPREWALTVRKKF